ncbi:MAG: methyltransferase [Candidatus Micrarchaeota archaeon]|nr:methyltransferase [Candidatus Micrarchaeota archaeon]
MACEGTDVPGFKDLSITTKDGVYEPAEDSFLAAEMAMDHIGRSKSSKMEVADIGTGSGILGLSAATSPKVSSVTFADINPGAIELAKANAEANRKLLKASCRFVVSDLFAGVKGDFDLIMFNAPYLPAEEGKSNPVDLIGGKKGVELSIRLMAHAEGHMKDGSRLLLVCSSLSDTNALLAHVKSSGLRVYGSRKAHFFFEDIIAMMLGR